jgi:hypothetical protein
MSSVNGSDSSSSRDEVRKNREDYRKNEAELVKKHARELRRLNEAHAQEVESLKADHDRQIEEVQKQARESITDRDNKYQSEIENIRSLHRKQLQNTTEDAQKRDELYRDTVKRESDSRAQTSDERVKSLSEQYNRANRDRDENLTRTLGQYRDESARGLTEQKDRLDKSYQKELDMTRLDRDQKIGQLQGQYDLYHKNAEGRLKDQQVKHMEDMQRASDSQMRALQKERSERAEAEDRWRDASSGSLADIRQHFQDSINKNRDDFDAARARFEDNYHGHIEPEMQNLRNKYQDAVDKGDRDMRQMEMKAAREKNQFRDAYSKNIENYKMQRDEAIRAGNERRSRDIETINGRNEKELADTHRFYNQKMDDQNRRLKTEYRNINGDFKARNEQVQSMADLRVKSVIDDTEAEKQRLVQQQSDSHDLMRRQQAETLRNLRMDTDAEKSDAIERIKELAKQKELGHSEQMAQMQESHKREVVALQDQLLRERKSADDSLKRTIDDLNKARKTELDQQMSKYEERIRVLQNTQSEELRRVNRAHEEKLSQLAATTRKA